MAVTTEKSTQMTSITAVPKREVSVKELGARLRTLRFDFTQSAAVGDAGSTADLVEVPAGARILANLSFIKWDAFGAARLLDIGLRAHRNAQTGALVAENAEAINSDIDVNAAGRASFAADANGAIAAAGDSLVVVGVAVLYATVAGGTIPAGTKLQGDVIYVVD
jgi:hypothetical protein